MHKEIQNQTATESQKVRDDEVGQTENPLFSGHMPKNHVTLSAISNRYMTENDWTDDMIHRPKMRRKRMEDSLGLNYANRPNWNRNVSNIQPNENAPELPDEELAERELLAQNKAIQRLERTACWLLPCTLVCKLLNLIFCTYKIEIGVPGKFKRSVGDPTKMLRQNIYGLLMGILTGFFLFLLFIFTFSNNPRLSTLLSAYVMLISVFGIAFSEDFRCIALLSLPYLVASRLRWLLMLFATAVSISGPGINFLHNSGNFRNSIACILAQVSTNMLLIQKLTAAPFSLLKNQLESLIEGLNETLNKMRNSLARINFSLLKVTNVMEQQSSWIVSLVDACGDPVSLKNQCLSFLNNIYFNCRSSMGPFAFLCGLVRQFAADTCTGDIGATQLCAQQKEVLQDKLEIDSKETLRRKMDNILNLLGKTNLSLQGNFDQYEKLTIESDNTVLSILQQRMDSFISMVEHGKFILTWIMVIWTLLTMLQLIIQAAIFRKSWIYRDTFDNYYITPAFVQQERRAMIQGLVPTIPLVRGETKRYKKFSSFTWTISEKKKAFKSFILLFMWMGVMLMITFADYAMYQILITVTPVFSTDFSTYGARSAMGQDYEINERLESTPRVHGESSYANIVRALLGMLNPIQDVAMNVDATACRPTASPPSKTINGLVYGLLGLTLLSIFFEVYILRLRHMIMIWYYPQRGVQRAAWLRTHIRNNRGLFHRLIHKFRAVEVKPGRQNPKVTRFGKFLVRHPKIRAFLELLGIKRIMCAFCGEEGNPSKKAVFEDNFIRCVECGAYFCRICEVDLDSICMVCRTPLFALSVEVDFEQFSSDEEFEAICARYLRRAEQTTVKAQKRESRSHVTAMRRT
ncbi:DC-STAMP domain-containing protein 2 [Clonorchis sinensis]|uniref:DC-STAMP domain-containing protein 2 n=1 Tax=Clonorchis sinensis TaxID=79923 RepID=A0A419PR26_CLOSI|nr:DC-STAMP domain-containing protein 2 [Clonorchis sinensis]